MLSGTAVDHWLTKPFDGGRAVIRVIDADGTLRVSLGDAQGKVIRAYPQAPNDIEHAKEIAECGIARLFLGIAEAQRDEPRSQPPPAG
ncbi:hypothetical protein U3653_00835 [Nocardia sp. CDC186]|uniref:Uncharacterized protein n=1 Tax=Nocardia implantans TaxID=3108168 RepID=A0ABU6AMH4_9NOCA|nr:MULTISPECIES: hypothetical protein [unclassified Nocardia]MBF6193456.1 hypothetical protein [Nocardia beijingensis]MEA3532632.1 hypothetical protein [Nocardia sp. CDC192]MEB3508556.1 hypothetical protein [Nocardia sp. CDC186]